LVGSGCNLESSNGYSVTASASNSDFTFSKGQVLTPTAGTFYLYSS
jgi:hypothetical protein